MKAITSIRRSRTLRNVDKSGTPAVQKSWPYPQKSIGRFIIKIGKESCWDAVGPARTAFLTLGQDIKHHLESYSEPTSTWITWSIYMVGGSPETAVPTIIFCCEDEVYRKAARNTIRDSHILERTPGIALKHLPRAPDYNQLVQLASLSDGEASNDVELHGSRSHEQPVFGYSRPVTIGDQLYIRTQGQDESTRKATAGGVIYVLGRACITTAAHAFATPTPTNPAQHEDDLYFSDSEDIDTLSVTSEFSDFSLLVVDDSQLLRIPDSFLPGDPHELRDLQSEDVIYHAKSDLRPPSKSPDAQLPASLAPIGNTLFLSTEGAQPDLDYAIVRLVEDQPMDSDKETTPVNEELGLPQLTDAEGFRCLENESVTVRAASAGAISGSINTTPTYIRAPHTATYQDVYRIRLEHSLSYGDSGSWVFDAQSGSLHGHIIAGCPNIGVAYIVPAYRIFKDISTHLDIIQERLGQLEQTTEDDSGRNEVVEAASESQSMETERLLQFHAEYSSTHHASSENIHYDDLKPHHPNIEPLRSSKLPDSPNCANGIPSISAVRPLRHAGKSVHLRPAEPAFVGENPDNCDISSPGSSSVSAVARQPLIISSSIQEQGANGSISALEEGSMNEATEAQELTRQFRALLSHNRVRSLRRVGKQKIHPRPSLDVSYTGPPPYSDKSPSHLYPTLSNIPCVPSQPVQPTARRFRYLLHSLASIPLRWEKPGLLDEALQLIPLERIYGEAEEEAQIFQAEAESLGSHLKPAWDYSDCTARSLLRWFKRNFFTWVNDPPCSRCYGPTVAQGMTDPNHDERAFGATTVELYQCSLCRNPERFPRYSDPFVLMRTRRGRVGEWASCFGMMCRALGCRVRWVWNAEDQVWIELWSAQRKRWIHVDPTDEAWDKPRLYTEDWNRKLTYCIAFSSDDVADVTCRYVHSAKHAKLRDRCSEAELMYILDEIRTVRHEKVNEEQRTRLQKEHVMERSELQRTIINTLVADLCSLKLETLPDGSLRIVNTVLKNRVADDVTRQRTDANAAGIKPSNSEIH